MRHFSLGVIYSVLFFTIGLSGCATSGVEENNPWSETPYMEEEDLEGSFEAQPLNLPPQAPAIPAPRSPQPDPPEEVIVNTPLWYNNLPGWEEADTRPALASFRRSCKSWVKADPDAFLNKNLPDYGVYRDWLPACAKVRLIGPSEKASRDFFETEFAPLSIKTLTDEAGTLTGYYEPEIDVRLTPDETYREPILAKPTNPSVMKKPRSEINANSSRVIAYGRPIDVFFMQIQGSGRLRYPDGRSLRAAYAGNNGKPYTSIGRVLVERGEMKLSQASKQSIEAWMERNGPKKTRALMNENPRYIFFAEQSVAIDAFGIEEGPRGAMEVPLTEMGSIAVDPRYHPYGTLVWLETKLPQEGGDYKGKETGILVSAQDTGKAIRGALRGDLFFGAGDDAGNRAGVMKHDVRWKILVPKSIARSQPVS
tara:strand:- start:96 stop:1367 length:1272 start_codon:yes stop_codon:yes gene_type:complete